MKYQGSKTEYEYFSKFWKKWKPVLTTDRIDELKKYGYKIRRTGGKI